MGITERISDEIKTLPEGEAREVLDFVGYLKTRRHAAEEEAAWSAASLAGALTGLENDVFPEYLDNDLIERWQ